MFFISLEPMNKLSKLFKNLKFLDTIILEIKLIY
jgi:hypothetical protein